MLCRKEKISGKPEGDNKVEHAELEGERSDMRPGQKGEYGPRRPWVTLTMLVFAPTVVGHHCKLINRSDLMRFEFSKPYSVRCGE